MTRKDIMDYSGVSRSRLNQLLKGYYSKGKFYPPVLVEGEDYIPEHFKKSALKKIQSMYPGKKRD